MRLNGFTLVIDGDEEEVQRLFDAMSAEFQAIAKDAEARRDSAFRYASPQLPFVLAAHSLHGRIELRERES